MDVSIDRGTTTGSKSAVESLRKKTAGSKIEILTDSEFETLQTYYSKAKIYWHAAGFGEDLEKHPDRAEHFGMSTVEAMSAGCVPVVFAGGGQLEIVQSGIKTAFCGKKPMTWKNIQKN